MRVLAADDDEALSRLLDRQLRGWGYEATIAHGGLEAWAILKKDDAPRVVILDWDMPGLSGLEVCRLFRSTSHGKDAYVLMLTGRGAKEDLVQALESGADDFLSKPFHPRELQLRLAKGVREAVRDAGPAAVSGTLPTGSTLGGKYRLEKKIGEGGMGSVWLGVHLSLGINVAIKFMARALAETPDYVSFEREAHAAAQLRDPHIVRVYDHGIAHDGLPYLVMEYVAGDSLADWVARRGPLAPFALASLVEQVAGALGEAHARQIVHRDVKPENILMVEEVDADPGFLVKLIDFGLARPWRPPALPPPSERGSADGLLVPTVDVGSVVAGTPVFMSPEYLTSSAPPSPMLDLWGLAVTAYFAVTGALPYDSTNLYELHRRMNDEPPPSAAAVRRDVPRGFDAWFTRACARDPDARFQSAVELAAALTAVCANDSAPDAGAVVARSPPSFFPAEADTATVPALSRPLVR